MRQMQSAALMGFLATLVLTSASVLAVEIDVEVDKRIVSPGDSITVTGAITDDEGNPGTFEYRAAAIVPKHRNGGDRIIICDSGKQTTSSDGKVSFECKIPTLEELTELGVENAAERSVIPIKGGIAVRDPATNESEREHGKALIVNTDNIKDKLNNALERIDSFIAHAQELQARCENITARAEEAGAESVIERCGEFQEKLQEKIDKAVAAQERINGALENTGNLSGFNFDDLKGGLINFRDGAKDFKVEVKDLREFATKARVEFEKRVSKEIREKAIERAKEVREQIKERKENVESRIKELRDKAMERKGKLRPASAETTTASDVETAAEEAETSSTESSSDSSESSGSETSGSGG